ncbi:hypothetical protein Tco_0591922 [Tanacetum coccineum]
MRCPPLSPQPAIATTLPSSTPSCHHHHLIVVITTPSSPPPTPHRRHPHLHLVTAAPTTTSPPIVGCVMVYNTVAFDLLRDALSAIFGLSELKEISKAYWCPGYPLSDFVLGSHAKATILGVFTWSDPYEEVPKVVGAGSHVLQEVYLIHRSWRSCLLYIPEVPTERAAVRAEIAYWRSRDLLTSKRVGGPCQALASGKVSGLADDHAVSAYHAYQAPGGWSTRLTHWMGHYVAVH